MKLTKVLGISHYKKSEPSEGELKVGIKVKADTIQLNSTIKIIEERFKKQIEGRIYKEFFSVVELKRYKENIKKEKIRIENNRNIPKEIIALYSLIEELYLNKFKHKERKYEARQLEKIKFNDENHIYIEKYSYIDKKTKEKKSREKKIQIRKGYKLKEGAYLYKELEEQKEEALEFISLFKDLINEISGTNLNQDDIRKTTAYCKLQDIFDRYAEKKIFWIEKSIKNNKVNVKIEDKKIIENSSKKEKFYLELLEKYKSDENNSKLEEEIKVFFSDSINFRIKKIVEIVNLKNEKDTNKAIKGRLYSELRRKINSESENFNEYLKYGERLIIEELKKYVKNGLSRNKEKIKEQTGEKRKSEELYYEYLKKIFSNEDKIKREIFEGIKNKFVSHVIEYGKYLYYIKNDAWFKTKITIGTEDLEYIKAKESLTRKISTLIAFSIHSYNRLSLSKIPEEELMDNEMNNFYSEKIGVKYEEENIKYIDEAKLKYFFPEIDLQNNFDFIKTLHKALSEVRNQVAHYRIAEDKIKLGNSINESAIEYFKKKINSVKEKVEEKFYSNNIDFYYTKEEMNEYFKEYEFSLLKIKVPFAPNFKRVLKKGEKLFEGERKFKNSEVSKYDYFFISLEAPNEEEKAYVRGKNYLLKELYYNNFFKEFLNDKDKIRFDEAIKNAKKRKEFQEKNGGKKVGVSYKQFSDLGNETSIPDYISALHSVETEKLKEEKYNVSLNKEKSQYITEFLEDVFLEGFIKWLDDKNLQFIKEINFNRIETIEEKKKKKESLRKFNYKNLKVSTFDLNISDKSEDLKKGLLLFLVFMFSDNNRVSEFFNEVIKYEQYANKKMQNINELKKFLGIDLNIYKYVCELVLLTKSQITTKECENTRNVLRHNNHLINKYYKNIDEYEDVLKKFIENQVLEESKNIKKEENTVYHSTDKKTPILYGNIEKTRQYGINFLLEKTYKKYSVIEREKFKVLSKEIEHYQKKKAILHEKLIVIKKNYVNTYKVIEEENEEEKEYEESCKKIREYNYLKKKQTLHISYELHEIISDIQGRYLAFINKYDRDFIFFLRGIGEEKISKEAVPLILEKNIVKPFFNKRKELYQIRNYIAHFHHFIEARNEAQEQKGNKSFIDQMNCLIELFSYDKKTKNHINKSLKTILEKYNMDLTFKLEDETNSLDKYKIDKIISKKGKLLGANNSFEILEDSYVNEVKKLLEYRL